VVRIDGELPEGVLGEVRIHREIYRRRPEIQGVARTMPPKIMSLMDASSHAAVPSWVRQLFLSRYSTMGSSPSDPRQFSV
jgi:ribulose-5-phosphate 4-epimerase/fuculose-1-phosphate aldolase